MYPQRDVETGKGKGKGNNNSNGNIKGKGKGKGKERKEPPNPAAQKWSHSLNDSAWHDDDGLNIFWLYCLLTSLAF